MCPDPFLLLLLWNSLQVLRYANARYLIRTQNNSGTYPHTGDQYIKSLSSGHCELLPAPDRSCWHTGGPWDITVLCHKSPSETKTASKLGEMEGIRSCQMMEETQSHENMNIFPLPEERKKRNMFTANLFVLGRDVLSFLVVTSNTQCLFPWLIFNLFYGLHTISRDRVLLGCKVVPITDCVFEEHFVKQ